MLSEEGPASHPAFAWGLVPDLLPQSDDIAFLGGHWWSELRVCDFNFHGSPSVLRKEVPTTALSLGNRGQLGAEETSSHHREAKCSNVRSTGSSATKPSKYGVCILPTPQKLTGYLVEGQASKQYLSQTTCRSQLWF